MTSEEYFYATTPQTPITPKVLFSKSNEANSSSDMEESSKLFNLTPS